MFNIFAGGKRQFVKPSRLLNTSLCYMVLNGYFNAVIQRVSLVGVYELDLFEYWNLIANQFRKRNHHMFSLINQLSEHAIHAWIANAIFVLWPHSTTKASFLHITLSSPRVFCFLFTFTTCTRYQKNISILLADFNAEKCTANKKKEAAQPPPTISTIPSLIPLLRKPNKIIKIFLTT